MPTPVPTVTMVAALSIRRFPAVIPSSRRVHRPLRRMSHATRVSTPITLINSRRSGCSATAREAILP